ncbi:MAG: thiamine phosphate synthase [Candidatus Omnitrophica bacterium]|nr:thiamine phosphate synthase [Candidatus Omnitrophota bacterium]
MPACKILKESRLYLVLDRQVVSYDRLFDIINESVAAGMDVVQIRDKEGTSCELLDFCIKAKEIINGRATFIVNDRLDLALAAEVDGVHLGQDDLPIVQARKIAGEKLSIGVSCQKLEQAIQAQKEGADYIGFGSVYKTLTKPDRCEMDFDLIKEVLSQIKIPVFFIGGINLNNVGRLCQAGVERVAVTRAVCFAENVADTVKDFFKILDNKYN